MLHGYFTDEDKLREALTELDDNLTLYFLGHKLKDTSLLPQNRFNAVKKGGSIKKDEIQGLKYLVIDIDPLDKKETVEGQVSDRNLTPEENQAVIQDAISVREELLNNGFSTVGLINSGNGAYLILPFKGISSINEAISMFKGFINLLAKRVKLKVSAFDDKTITAEHVFKLPGTKSTKGVETNDNPFRHAVIVEEWDIGVSCLKSIQEYVDKYSTSKLIKHSSNGDILDIDACIERFQQIWPVYYGGNQDFFVRVSDNSVFKDINIDSSDFAREVRIYLRNDTGLKVIADYVVDSVTTYMKDMAYQKTKSVMASRAYFSKVDNVVYYDLSNNRDVVKVSSNDITIVKKPLGMFAKQKTDSEQVMFVPTPASKLPELLKRIVNLDYQNLLILASYLCVCFLGNFFPTPILLITGSQGSSKSTLTRFIQRIVHPQSSGLLSLQDKKQDIAIALSTRLLSCFDNATGVKAEISDLLCSAVTKGCFQTRELYTTADERLIEYKSILVINGIDVISRRTDLMERALLLELPSIKPENRKTEKEVEDIFTSILPEILGAIFDAIRQALAMEKLELPTLSRMADYENWGAKFCIAIGETAEVFQEALQNNINRLVDAVSFGNPVIFAITELMRGKSVHTDGVQHFYVDCLGVLALKATQNERSAFPKSAAALSRILGGMEKNLKSFGITFSIKNVGPKKEITLWNDGTVIPKMYERANNSKIIY